MRQYTLSHASCEYISIFNTRHSGFISTRALARVLIKPLCRGLKILIYSQEACDKVFVSCIYPWKKENKRKGLNGRN
jgi:hypothetical protein